MKKEFKVKLNPAILYFEIFYVIYVIYLAIIGYFSAVIASGALGILIIGYFSLWRPYKYTIDRKLLIVNRRLGKDKEINIMDCETVCDPVPKMTKIITSPRALEIYTEGKKRYVFNPKERMEFIEALVSANKRIHVQVSEYAATHRAFEKKRRKELKKELAAEHKNKRNEVEDAK